MTTNFSDQVQLLGAVAAFGGKATILWSDWSRLAWQDEVIQPLLRIVCNKTVKGRSSCPSFVR